MDRGFYLCLFFCGIFSQSQKLLTQARLRSRPCASRIACTYSREVSSPKGGMVTDKLQLLNITVCVQRSHAFLSFGHCSYGCRFSMSTEACCGLREQSSECSGRGGCSEPNGDTHNRVDCRGCIRSDISGKILRRCTVNTFSGKFPCRDSQYRS